MATIEDLVPLLSNLVAHLTLGAHAVIDFCVNISNRNKLLEHLSKHNRCYHYDNCTFCKYEADIVQPRERRLAQAQHLESRDEVDTGIGDDYETPDSLS